jgi:hypothetical protein
MMKLKLFFFLIIMSFTAYGSKILLNGKPAELIPEANYYRFPAIYTSTTTYHYVEIAGDQRVCFLDNIPQLSSLDLLRIDIVFKGKKFLWYCYRFSPEFFERDY